MQPSVSLWSLLLCWRSPCAVGGLKQTVRGGQCNLSSSPGSELPSVKGEEYVLCGTLRIIGNHACEALSIALAALIITIFFLSGGLTVSLFFYVVLKGGQVPCFNLHYGRSILPCSPVHPTCLALNFNEKNPCHPHNMVKVTVLTFQSGWFVWPWGRAVGWPSHIGAPGNGMRTSTIDEARGQPLMEHKRSVRADTFLEGGRALHAAFSNREFTVHSPPQLAVSLLPICKPSPHQSSSPGHPREHACTHTQPIPRLPHHHHRGGGKCHMPVRG